MELGNIKPASIVKEMADAYLDYSMSVIVSRALPDVRPHDRIALRWLLGFGSADFRKGAYARLRKYCDVNGTEPFEALTRLAASEIAITRTGQLVVRFKEIQVELTRLHALTDMAQFVSGWLLGNLGVDDPFYNLALDLSLTADSQADLVQALVTTVAQPDVPPDVTEVRIMSLHKSKGLSSPVVIIAGCVEGLLPAAPLRTSAKPRMLQVWRSNVDYFLLV